MLVIPVLLKRLNGSAVSVTASGVDVGGALTITLDGVSLKCDQQVLSSEDLVGAGHRARGSTAVTLALPTAANLIGKSVTAVCEA